jgi:hypothetical protein
MKVCISFERRTHAEKEARLKRRISRRDAKALRRVAERNNYLNGTSVWVEGNTVRHNGERGMLMDLADKLEGGRA